MRKTLSFATISGVALALLVVAFASPANAQAGPFQFFPLSPCRVIDTRDAAYAPALVGQGGARSFTIKGAKKVGDPATDCGVPLDAKAVAINVTIAGPTSPGYLSIWPAGTAQPVVSTINFTTADYALANGAVVPLAAATPDLAVYYYGFPIPSSVHLIVDVNGFFR